MTQTRQWAFQDPASSRLANRKQSRVVDAGPYAGFFPRVTQLAGVTNRIDLTTGDDGVSVAVTGEGARIEEDTNLVGVVQFDNPSTSGQTRYDLVVLEYQYTTNRTAAAIYKVIKGNFAALGVTPEIPVAQNEFQVPLCTVLIRSVTATTGPSLVQLAQSDLFPVARGQDVSHPSELAALKPIVDPTSAGDTRLFVYGGSFPRVDRQTIIDFVGGYSAEIDPLNLVAIGTTEYRVYGVTDAGAVEVIETVSSFLSNPTNVEFAVPVCVAEITNSTGLARIVRIRDIRQFVSRLGTGDSEVDVWTDMFHDTYFDQLVFEPFLNLNLVNETTFKDNGTGNAPSDVTYALDQATSSLVFSFGGSTPPTGDVELVIGDFVAGNFTNPAAAIREFMALALHDIPDLQYAYSFSGLTSGYSTPQQLTDLLNSPIVKIPGSAPSQLYLKLIIPSSSSFFGAGAASAGVRSVGILANIDSEVAARNVILNDNQATLETATRNLIGNPFQRWSNPSTSQFAAPYDNSNFSLEISGTQTNITNRDLQFGPDGWQAMWSSGQNSAYIATREPLVTDAYMYQMRLEVPTAAGTPAQLPLEYRIPIERVRIGDAVSFAVNVDTPDQNLVRLGIRFYRRPATGLSYSEVFSALNTGGFQRLLVTTDALTVDADVVAVGFVIYYSQSGGKDTEIVFSDPMAALGRFSEVLTYAPPPNMVDEAKHYVSVHRMQQRGFTAEPAPVGMMIPHPFKYAQLGTLRARAVTLPDAQNSENVGSITYSIEDNGQDIGVFAESVGAGPFVIDSQVIAEVLYEKV